MTSAERVAVVGTGLIGTSIAMAAVRAGEAVRGFDADPDALARAAEASRLTPVRPSRASAPRSPRWPTWWPRPCGSPRTRPGRAWGAGRTGGRPAARGGAHRGTPRHT